MDTLEQKELKLSEVESSQLANIFVDITIQVKHLDLKRADLIQKQVAVLNELEARALSENKADNEDK